MYVFRQPLGGKRTISGTLPAVEVIAESPVPTLEGTLHLQAPVGCLIPVLSFVVCIILEIKLITATMV